MLTLTEPMSTRTTPFTARAPRGAERRRGLRVRQSRPVKVFEPRYSRYFGGQTSDVSATGLRIELPAFAIVREGETLNVHVGLNGVGQSLANRRSMMPARVAWVDRNADTGKLAIGVEFISNLESHLNAA